MSDDTPHSGALAAILALIGVAAIVGGAVWIVKTRQLLGGKNSGGVAFENPSYLREVNMDHMQVTTELNSSF